MIQSLSRSACRCQNTRFRPDFISYIAQPSKVAVENPRTKKKEEQTVFLQVEEPVIEPKLRASDFDLKVLLENKVNLTDCGKVFIPSIEQYDRMFAGVSRNLSYQQEVVRIRDLKSKEVKVETPKTE